MPAFVASLVSCLLLVSCGGGSGNTSSSPASPTAPSSTNSQSSSSQWVGVGSFGLYSDSLTDNLLVVEFRIDGTLENRFTSSGQATFIYGGSVNGKVLSGGQHTLSVVIVSQVKSPHVYVSSGDLLFQRGTSTNSITCPTQTWSIATGQSVSCSFTLPS